MPSRHRHAAFALAQSGCAPLQNACFASRRTVTRLVVSGVGAPMSKTVLLRPSLAATVLAMASDGFIAREGRFGREAAFSEGSTIPRMESHRTSGL